MSRILARLERQGYVVRRPTSRTADATRCTSPTSGRAASVEAGDPGVAEELTLRGLTHAQVQTLRELLHRDGRRAGLVARRERPGTLATRPERGRPMGEPTSTW